MTITVDALQHRNGNGHQAIVVVSSASSLSQGSDSDRPPPLEPPTPEQRQSSTVGMLSPANAPMTVTRSAAGAQGAVSASGPSRAVLRARASRPKGPAVRIGEDSSSDSEAESMDRKAAAPARLSRADAAVGSAAGFSNANRDTVDLTRTSVESQSGMLSLLGQAVDTSVAERVLRSTSSGSTSAGSARSSSSSSTGSGSGLARARSGTGGAAVTPAGRPILTSQNILALLQQHAAAPGSQAIHSLEELHLHFYGTASPSAVQSERVQTLITRLLEIGSIVQRGAGFTVPKA